MKALVFVWTLKDVVAAVFIGIVILYVGYVFIRYYVATRIEEWKYKKNNKKEEEQ